MPLAIAPERLLLAEDADGVMRVGRTRVTLDTVVGAFNDGASAEDIVSMYFSRGARRDSRDPLRCR